MSPFPHALTFIHLQALRAQLHDSSPLRNFISTQPATPMSSQSVRRFRHKTKFGDTADYIEVRPEGSFVVDKDGTRKTEPFYSLSQCLKYVAKGAWIELPVLGPNPSAIAEGHNPDKVTNEQLGVSEGWRLLSKAEVEHRRGQGEALKSTLNIQMWLPGSRRWYQGNVDGNTLGASYRTKLPKDHFLPARKPEPDPEHPAITMSRENAQLKTQLTELRAAYDTLKAVRAGDSGLIERLRKESIGLITDKGLLASQLATMQKNASGNAVLVLSTGFSLPTTVFTPGGRFAPFYHYGLNERNWMFRTLGAKDGFGRVIYHQV